MYPGNPIGTQVIVGSMNMYRTLPRFELPTCFECVPIPLGHSDGLLLMILI